MITLAFLRVSPIPVLQGSGLARERRRTVTSDEAIPCVPDKKALLHSQMLSEHKTHSTSPLDVPLSHPVLGSVQTLDEEELEPRCEYCGDIDCGGQCQEEGVAA